MLKNFRFSAKLQLTLLPLILLPMLIMSVAVLTSMPSLLRQSRIEMLEIKLELAFQKVKETNYLIVISDIDDESFIRHTSENRIRNLIREIELPYGQFFVYNTDEKRFLVSPDDSTFISSDSLDLLSQKNTLPSRIQLENESMDKTLLLLEPFEPWQLIIGVGITYGELNRPILRLVLIFVLLVSFFLIVTIFLIRMTSRSISLPLVSLVEVVSAFGTGDRNRRTSVEGRDEIAVLASSFNTMADRIEAYMEELHHTVSQRSEALDHLRETQAILVHKERLAAMGQFSAGVAHDFNNLLTSILMTADLLLQSGQLSQDSTDGVNTILESGEKAAQLVRQILDYSRKSIRKEKELDLETVLGDTIKILQSGITEQYSLRLETAGYDGITLWADQTQVEQVLINLVVNARDAMQAGGEILVELKNHHFTGEERCSLCSKPIKGDYVEISVEDGGCGMDKATMDSIFEPYFTTKEVGKGSGLGLAQVYGIVSQYDGHIQLVSELGKGTKISVLLPRSPRYGPP